jgi:hypothetical protein
MAPASKITISDNGNMNLDFLFGLLVFMMAFLYVVNAVPGIFLPYQSNAVDLGSVAYRTSTILAEDPGWWSCIDEAGVKSNGTEWETSSNTQYLARIGLANDKLHPNQLSFNKIYALSELSYDQIQEKLGLGNITDTVNNTMSYKFKLSIKEVNSTGQHTELLPSFIWDPDVYYTDIAESIERVITIDHGHGIIIDSSDNRNQGSTSKNIDLTLNGTLSGTESLFDPVVDIRLIHMNIADNTSVNMTVKYGFTDDVSSSGVASYGMSGYNYPDDEYYIYKNNKYVEDPASETYNASDVVDIAINAEIINNRYLAPGNYSLCYLFLSFDPYTAVIFPPKDTGFGIDVDDLLVCYNKGKYYQDIFEKGTMKLQVWQT